MATNAIAAGMIESQFGPCIRAVATLAIGRTVVFWLMTLVTDSAGHMLAGVFPTAGRMAAGTRTAVMVGRRAVATGAISGAVIED